MLSVHSVITWGCNICTMHRITVIGHISKFTNPFNIITLTHYSSPGENKYKSIELMLGFNSSDRKFHIHIKEERFFFV